MGILIDSSIQTYTTHKNGDNKVFKVLKIITVGCTHTMFFTFDYKVWSNILCTKNKNFQNDSFTNRKTYSRGRLSSTDYLPKSQRCRFSCTWHVWNLRKQNKLEKFPTVWNSRKSTLTCFWQRFRENYVFTKVVDKVLISRNIFSLREFLVFHTVLG